jgi:hypothetical protein
MAPGAVPTPPEEAVGNARAAARMAESLDSAGSARAGERNVAMAFANMWSLLAIAEAVQELKETIPHGTHTPM